MQQNDYPRFKALMGGLCDMFGKPLSEELLDSYWKSLRNCNLQALESKIDDFIARAGESTRFPKPSQLRPDDVPLPGDEDSQDWKRGFWRLLIVQHLEDALMLAKRVGTPSDTEAYLVANREEMAGSLQLLLDELNQANMDDQGNLAFHYRECRRVVQNTVYAHLRRLGLPTNAPRSA